MTHWYKTPIKLTHIHSMVSPKWGKCGSLSSFIYCWWSCPIIETFWKEVLNQIQLIGIIKSHWYWKFFLITGKSFYSKNLQRFDFHTTGGFSEIQGTSKHHQMNWVFMGFLCDGEIKLCWIIALDLAGFDWFTDMYVDPIICWIWLGVSGCIYMLSFIDSFKLQVLKWWFRNIFGCSHYFIVIRF